MEKRKSVILTGGLGFLPSHLVLSLWAVLLMLVATASPLHGEIRTETINLRVTAVSESQIALTWTIPVGAVKYRVYRDGSLLVTTGRISEYDARLKGETRYCYRIFGIDDQNVEFSRSKEACATTLAEEASQQTQSIPAPLK